MFHFQAIFLQAPREVIKQACWKFIHRHHKCRFSWWRHRVHIWNASSSKQLVPYETICSGKIGLRGEMSERPVQKDTGCPQIFWGKERNLVLFCLNNFQCQHLEYQYNWRLQERCWVVRDQRSHDTSASGFGSEATMSRLWWDFHVSLWRQENEQLQKQKNYQDDVSALWYPGISPAAPFSSVTVTGRVPAAGHNSPSHKTWGRITVFMPETTNYKTSSLVFKGIWNGPRATFLSWMPRRKLQRSRELMIQHACQDQEMGCGTHCRVRTKSRIMF